MGEGIKAVFCGVAIDDGRGVAGDSRGIGSGKFETEVIDCGRRQVWKWKGRFETEVIKSGRRHVCM